MSDAAALLPTQGTDFEAALSVPPVTNLRRIGGEMFAWSDFDTTRTGKDLPRGAVLRHLIGEFAGPGKSVLVAGPHSDEVVRALVDGGATVSWLMRSLVDAEAAARSHPGVTVLSGAAIKLDPAERYDLVVAADGVERLNSGEGEQMTSGELLDRLAEAIRPEGVLVLMHDNPLGLHHTVRLLPGARERSDAEWYAEDEHDLHRPASREQLVERLSGAGLAINAAYAAFPEPTVPTVLIGEGVLGNVNSPVRPRLGTALSQALAAGFRGRPVLSDPRRLANRALRAGAESTVAPGWLVVARGQASSVPATAGAHELLIGDPHGTFAYEVAADAGQVRTTVVQPLAEGIERNGLRRIGEPAAPGADAGYVLEERLLSLAAAHDIRQLRVEMAHYDGWLRAHEQNGTVSGAVAVAGLADVFVADQGLSLLPSRWEPIEPVAVEVAEIRAIWQFAVQLITSGQPHPWPVTSSAVDLTTILLGMVGVPVAPDDVRAAVDLHIALEGADNELSLAEQHDRKLQLLAVTPGTASVDVAGFRELTEALWRQRYQASHLLAQMDWTEQMIKSRDLAVSKMDWEVNFYRKSWAGRMLMIARSGYRVVMRDGRKFVRGRRKRKAAAAAENAIR